MIDFINLKAGGTYKTRNNTTVFVDFVDGDSATGRYWNGEKWSALDWKCGRYNPFNGGSPSSLDIVREEKEVVTRNVICWVGEREVHLSLVHDPNTDEVFIEQII